MAAATRPWGDLGLNLRLKLSKNYTFSMSSSFKTYGYKFDKNGKCGREMTVRNGPTDVWYFPGIRFFL